jgi:hypothetical protein
MLRMMVWRDRDPLDKVFHRARSASGLMVCKWREVRHFGGKLPLDFVPLSKFRDVNKPLTGAEKRATWRLRRSGLRKVGLGVLGAVRNGVRVCLGADVRQCDGSFTTS